MLSAVVIAQDEAHRIGRCLDSLRFADEILVVDGGSADGTQAVASGAGARIVAHAFAGFPQQRTAGEAAAAGPWVLHVDADEVVPPALALEIRAAIAPTPHSAFRMPRLDYMFGRWIRHGGWLPQYQTRLMLKGSGEWTRPVHERWVTRGTVGTLLSPLHHYSHLEVADFVSKLNRYTSESARARALAGESIPAWRLALEPPAYFAYKYIYQRGFLDGAHGFVLASLLACYRGTELAKIRFHGSADRVTPP